MSGEGKGKQVEERAGIVARVSAFEGLPDDVLAQVLGGLEVDELIMLQALNKPMRDRILQFGIPLYASSHPCSHITLSPGQSSWKPYDLVRHNTQIARSLRHRRWHALQIGPTWSQKVIPTLSLTPDRLVLGVGGKLVIHPLVNPSRKDGVGGYGMKAVGRSREYIVAKRYAGSGADIVGVAEVGDDQLGVAQYDGTLQRLEIPSRENGLQNVRSTAHYPHPKGSNIHTFTASGETMMTVTSTGLVSLWQIRSPWLPPNTLQLAQGARAWSSLLVTDNSYLPPVAMLGLSGGMDIHPILPTGLAPTPSRQLLGPKPPATSSPYDITLPPSPSTHHPSLLLSAWYDSHLRLHDLRASSSSPVATFLDPYTWADGSAMYSCAFLSESYISGGGARHGTVTFFDIRNPKHGWSCFSPGGKGSPVYSMQGEGGRIWGVTERRAFVLAFDGSGGEVDGLVLSEARAVLPKVEDRPTGWKGRGGRWGWSVKYNNGRNGGDEGERNRHLGGGEVARGYEHAERTVSLFDSLPAA